MSNKASHAENQQERLIMIGWITGFVDGEGCFSINFIKQPERQESTRVRRGYKTGYQVAHEFAVVQGEKSLESLKKLREHFGVGGLYINKRYDNHKEHLYRYCVRKREDLLNVIIPFFEQYPLTTFKQHDFKNFIRCMKLIQKGEHLTNDGLIKIAQITETMNHRKMKTHMIGILRNQTPSLEK
jgi:hypothetical protein